MAQTQSMQQPAKAATAAAKREATKPWVVWLERLGFLARGMIYFVIGLLALQLALGAGGATVSPTSAIQVIGRQPFGNVLLVLIALGLVGYALWGLVRAFLDPLGRGSDAKGLLARAGFLFSGLSYALLLIPTFAALTGKPVGPAGAAAGGGGVPSGLLSGTMGHWLGILVGLFWLAAGIGQIMVGYRKSFLHDLKLGVMSHDEQETASWLGQAGYIARGIVFALLGVLILQPGVAGASAAKQSFDGALATLAHGPYGEVLLGAVALGLMLFGLYSALCAKWVRIGARSSRRSG